jgi:hypothetical protein
MCTNNGTKYLYYPHGNTMTAINTFLVIKSNVFKEFRTGKYSFPCGTSIQAVPFLAAKYFQFLKN